MIGGTTYEEARAISLLNQAFATGTVQGAASGSAGVRLLLGGSCIHNSSRYLLQQPFPTSLLILVALQLLGDDQLGRCLIPSVGVRAAARDGVDHAFPKPQPWRRQRQSWRRWDRVVQDERGECRRAGGRDSGRRSKSFGQGQARGRPDQASVNIASALIHIHILRVSYGQVDRLLCGKSKEERSAGRHVIQTSSQ